MTPVFRMAVLAGIKTSVQLHLRLGGNVNATDDKGRTPLILAASRGHAEICWLLLEKGADLTHVDMEGNDAFRVATAKGHHAVAEIIRAAASSSESPILPQEAGGESPDTTGMAEDGGSARQEASEPASEETGIGPAVGQPEPSGSKFIPEAVALLPAISEDIPGRMPPEADHESPASHPQLDAEKFDLSGWEEEIDSPPPPADPTCASRADELQRQLSLHVPVDLDAEWDDVDIELPDILASVRRRAKLDGEEEAALKELVMAAIADGRIRGENLALVAPQDQDDPDRPDPDYVANLRMMLGDMGVIVDDDPGAPDSLSELGDPDDEDDRLRDETAEGLAFLRTLNSNRADPLTHYIGSLPRDRLTRDDEASLAIEIECGTKAALAAVAMSPAAVSELLAAIVEVIEGRVPPEAVLESDDEGEEEDDTGLEEEGDQADGMPEGPSLPPELLFRLEAVRDLCLRLLRGQDGGFAERLGDRLAALGLSHVFVYRLHRAVETDPSGCEARRLMEAGLEKARKARERFALANLKLVVWGAKKFGGMTWPDRIQEGNLGLLKAVERFDHRRGAKFSTYATWWIKQAVTRAVADKGRTIRIPVHAQEAMRKVRRAQTQVFALTGRDAAPEEIADLTEIPTARVRRFLAVSEEPFSLDTEEGWRETAEMAWPEPDPEETLATAEIRTLVRRQLEILSPKEATILRMRFGIGCDREHTLEEVGQQFGVTRERIRQIEAKALGKLSHPGRIKALQGCR